MKLSKLTLSQFRNIASLQADFSDGINIIYGDNAQGKTNMLEAVYLFARGRSFRTRKEAEMIAFGEEAASAEIEFFSKRGKQKMRAAYQKPDKRKRTVNGIEVRRASEFIGNFRGVLFYPDHLSIVKDSPSERRAFIDIALSQLRPAHVSFSQKYKDLLQQKNALLRDFSRRFYGSARVDAREKERFFLMLSVLNDQMAEAAAYITRFRAEYTVRLDEKVRGYFDEMTDGREKVMLSYTGDVNVYEDEAENAVRGAEALKMTYEALFSENAEKEAERGMALFGPHRDDMEISLSGKKARLFASQGQQRSVTLALKLAEGDIAKEDSGEYPVFLFDDVLSELDESRKQYLLSQLDGRQVIVTACGEDLFAGCEVEKKIRIKDGAIIE